MASERDRILPPYTRRVSDFRHFAVKATSVTLLLGFAMFLGFWLAVFGTLAVQPYIGILGLVLLLVFWMAPDSRVDYRQTITKQFMLWLGFSLAWPSYIALNAPGLPWITPSRIVFALLTFTFLLQLSQSKDTRDEIAKVIGHSKPAFLLYLVFIFTQLATVALARAPAESLSSTVMFIVLLNIPMLIALYVLTDPLAIKRVFRVVLICAVIMFLLSLGEYRMEQPIWARYIPSFLRVDPTIIETLVNSGRRPGDDRYRLRGMFAVALYYGQLVVILTPFVVHAVFKAKGPRNQALAAALLVLLIFISWGTNTRTAFSGMFLAIVLYVAIFALRRYLKPAHGSDVIGPAAMLAAPTFIVIMGVLIASSRRMRMWTVGGQQHAGSNDVRDMQWDRAIAALMQNPLGHGAGNAARIAGKPTSDGVWIIDSYWINLLLDYGVLGFLAFLGFFLLLAYHGIMDALRHDDDASQLCGVFGMSIIMFILTMYSLSYEGNFILPMLMAAGIAANRYRLSRIEAADRKVKAESALDLRSRALA